MRRTARRAPSSILQTGRSPRITWRGFPKLVPIAGVQVEVASPYPRAEVTCRGANVQTRREGGKLIMKVDSLDDYAALVISRV